MTTGLGLSASSARRPFADSPSSSSSSSSSTQAPLRSSPSSYPSPSSMLAQRQAIRWVLSLVLLFLPSLPSSAFTPSSASSPSSSALSLSTPSSLFDHRPQLFRAVTVPQPHRQLVVRDGIPKLFRWLTDQYPSVNQRINEGLGKHARDVDNLYLDMNGIIHMCTHANAADEVVVLQEKEMLQKIFAYTDHIYRIVKPKRVMYLAVDGVAPRAKMNQQRSRRFRSSRDQEQLMAEILARTGSIPDEATRFDSNCITPGTDFMYRLGLAFRKWIEFKCEHDPFWRKNGARIVFSGPDVPGEGEHKVMDYVRRAREEEEDWSPELRHVFYGLDADLIMLSLVTHEKHFMLLREKMSVRHGRDGPKDPSQYQREDFELLEISLLRKMLSLQFQALEDPGRYPFRLDLERLIDDFVFICMLVGNDFLPHLPHLDIADGSLNTMMNAYKDLLPTLGGYLTDKTRIHLPRFELFLREIARHEQNYFHRRGREENDPALADPNTYKARYYESKFGWQGLDEAELREEKRRLGEAYIAGLCWVLEYYHQGVSSWEWFFPHLYAPLASDLVDLATMDVKLERGRPVTPLMQLLSVLPSHSGGLLPSPYRDLMTDPLSPLARFYPRDFDTDLNGKKNAWEAVVKIPFLDTEALQAAVTVIDHKGELTPEERLRNLEGREHVFRAVPWEEEQASRGPDDRQGGRKRRSESAGKGRTKREEKQKN